MSMTEHLQHQSLRKIRDTGLADKILDGVVWRLGGDIRPAEQASRTTNAVVTVSFVAFFALCWFRVVPLPL
jgi:hypothetical protein